MPLAYPEYRTLFRHHLEYVQLPEEADLLIYSCFMDLQDDQQELERLFSRKPDLKLVVLSEEPFWDSLWSENYAVKRGELPIGGRLCSYTFLNHFTTRIFDFEEIPYFITTSNDYFARYSFLFTRNAAGSESALTSAWAQTPIRVAFFAEFRDEGQYDAYFPRHDVWGLSRYRTLIAEAIEGHGAVRVGHRWSRSDTVVRREYLPDWHLDKLAALDRKAFMVSAIENTHQWNYVTEKLFDAFATQAVPLYFANPLHAAMRLVPAGAFLNLYGLSVEQAVAGISGFRPDQHFAGAYLEAQTRLARLFSRPAELARERRRVVAEVVAELLACC
jgi:hypothetical protein